MSEDRYEQGSLSQSLRAEVPPASEAFWDRLDTALAKIADEASDRVHELDGAFGESVAPAPVVDLAVSIESGASSQSSYRAPMLAVAAAVTLLVGFVGWLVVRDRGSVETVDTAGLPVDAELLNTFEQLVEPACFRFQDETETLTMVLLADSALHDEDAIIFEAGRVVLIGSDENEFDREVFLFEGTLVMRGVRLGVLHPEVIGGFQQVWTIDQWSVEWTADAVAAGSIRMGDDLSIPGVACNSLGETLSTLLDDGHLLRSEADAAEAAVGISTGEPFLVATGTDSGSIPVRSRPQTEAAELVVVDGGINNIQASGRRVTVDGEPWIQIVLPVWFGPNEESETMVLGWVPETVLVPNRTLAELLDIGRGSTMATVTSIETIDGKTLLGIDGVVLPLAAAGFSGRVSILPELLSFEELVEDGVIASGTPVQVSVIDGEIHFVRVG